MAVHPPLEREVATDDRGQRHLRTTITLMVLLVLVAGSGWYAWRIVTNPGDEAEADVASTGPVCAMAVPSDPPPSEEININVYNATTRNALASQVARELREDGFVILDVANDPKARSIPGIAEIRAQTDENDAVAFVMSQFPGSVFVPDNRSDESIDVVLGDAFDHIGPQDDEPDPDSTPPPLPTC